jgi:hypothetical protein
MATDNAGSIFSTFTFNFNCRRHTEAIRAIPSRPDVQNGLATDNAGSMNAKWVGYRYCRQHEGSFSAISLSTAIAGAILRQSGPFFSS